MYHSIITKERLAIDFGVKRSKIKDTGQGSLHMVKNYDNFCLNWSIVFKLYKYITHHFGKTPGAFWVTGQWSRSHLGQSG